MTGVEDYQGNGVLFKGNIRGDPARAHRHISERLNVRAPCLSYFPGVRWDKPYAVFLWDLHLQLHGRAARGHTLYSQRLVDMSEPLPSCLYVLFLQLVARAVWSAV